MLVTDERAELIRELRRLAAARGLVPHVGAYAEDGLDIVPYPVVHTSHATFGYLITAVGRTVAWAPEFFEFPEWAAGSDLMFADAEGHVSSLLRKLGLRDRVQAVILAYDTGLVTPRPP